MRKVYVYYRTNDWATIRKIHQHFGFKHGITLNGMTCQAEEVRDEDWGTLLETERRGFIQIRDKK